MWVPVYFLFIINIYLLFYIVKPDSVFFKEVKHDLVVNRICVQGYGMVW